MASFNALAPQLCAAIFRWVCGFGGAKPVRENGRAQEDRDYTWQTTKEVVGYPPGMQQRPVGKRRESAKCLSYKDLLHNRQRQHEGESRPLLAAVDLKRAAHRLHQSPHDGEAQPRAGEA